MQQNIGTKAAAAALLLALTTTAVPALATDCADGGCWKLRFGINRTDGDEEILNVFPLENGSEERTKLHFSLLYRF